MAEDDLTSAIRHFEIAEANLAKLERLWDEIKSLIPSTIDFRDQPEYENKRRAFYDVLEQLPKIDGWKPEVRILEPSEIADARLGALELDEIECHVSVEASIESPGREIREYRFRFNRKRRELVRSSVTNVIEQVDRQISLSNEQADGLDRNKSVKGENWDKLKGLVDQIDALLGASVDRPARWSDLRRHLQFGQVGDLIDITDHDWPNVKEGIQCGPVSRDEPLSSEVEDLSDLVTAKPIGSISTKLNWPALESDEDFERLIFALISGEDGYENPQWLTRPKAPDRGRDLSVTRVILDALGGTRHHRVIIQCKHWLARSVTLPDVEALKGQMSLWDPPRVDVLVIATSGRFTTDAISFIEKSNLSDTALEIEMWPDSHLERLLAARPPIIAEFGLR